MGNDDNTIFHKIIRREIPADIVFEDERAIAFRDIQPAAPVHILVVPKKTLPRLLDAKSEDSDLLGHLLLIANQIARSERLTEEGYRVVINTGEQGGQSVFQLHVHLLGGRNFTWPPG